MKWTCIKCEFPYEDVIQGDAEERMCYKCLNKEETDGRC